MYTTTLFALLLQAAQDVAETEIPEESGEIIEQSIQSGLFDMVLMAGPFAKLVLLVLLGFSVLSWAIAFSKYGLLKDSNRKDSSFLKAFRRVGKMSEMNAAATERFELVNGLREAIYSGQLILMFQPQVEVAREQLIGAETLVRWEHPTRGIVSPSEFITVAEETGMMVPLGEWVLQAACRAAVSWKKLPDMRISVNISGFG